MENLLSNAEKYGGEEPVEVCARVADRYVEVSVADTGPGIDGDDVPRIFEPFYQGTSKDGLVRGLGLGLTVCQRLVSSMHGQMWVASRLTGGAEIGFSLPVWETAVGSVSQPPDE